MENVLLGLGLLAGLGLAIAIFFLPNAVRYSEKIVINAPVEQVYDNIRLQERLMLWSAWPEATGSTCSLENEDGSVGARTVFFDQGKRFEHQEIVDLKPNQKVALTLNFINTYHRPFHLPARLFGIVKWTRALQVKDLEGLKQYSELKLQKAL
ncbi:hypothetical protein IQ254_23790 [Nodosilinea sp. LEGE 07088]|uniref:hypothetical protein n=1 Tax=Nodosilinea sp. LEGE 07088 TaxID=2777968 RepID=UPI0018829FC0|nr:hypothetical protein [Nodosilinea sp. LEGE 07088]MBE9140183.1 hypothetical protein [Nodosilinea sp. LEGE 07088]